MKKVIINSAASAQRPETAEPSMGSATVLSFWNTQENYCPDLQISTAALLHHSLPHQRGPTLAGSLLHLPNMIWLAWEFNFCKRAIC